MIEGLRREEIRAAGAVILHGSMLEETQQDTSMVGILGLTDSQGYGNAECRKENYSHNGPHLSYLLLVFSRMMTISLPQLKIVITAVDDYLANRYSDMSEL